ncbi:hypothetical protein GALL_177390 [mine drainage metagenome]|uniref:Transposase InsH N-terminal domain-containing protein n=1 Tax=mine drainage metagenome TaxID=410659 RepID=A0A1J5RVT1_9ZZZZ
MRGTDSDNAALFSTVKLDDFIPANHPLRPIRTWLNEARAKMDAKFSAMIETEKLMRAMPLQWLYSVRQLVEQISDNLLTSAGTARMPPRPIPRAGCIASAARRPRS